MDPIELDAGNFRLRPWRADDVDAALAALLEPETRLWNAGWVQTRDDAVVWLERRQDWTGDHASWAVDDPASRALVGSVSLHSIDLCHAVENVASGRVAEKAGYRFEGRLRRSYRYGDGVKHDEMLWARLSDDPAPDLSNRS